MSAGGHDERLEALARRARGLKLDPKLPFSRSELIRHYFADVAEEDLEDRDPLCLAAAALGHLTWALARKRGVAKVRAFNPDGTRDGWTCEGTIVELVNDNMPFLVDSVTMALDRLGHGIELTLHPLLRVVRDAQGRLQGLHGAKRDAQQRVESYIHIEIRREADPVVLRHIESTLHDTVSDVRVAVDDWQPMLDELRGACTALRDNAPTPARQLEESCEFLRWLADDNFTLLGHHAFRLLGGGRADRRRRVPGTGLGILKEPLDASARAIVRAAPARRDARSNSPLVITKAGALSTVHRPGYLDQIDVRLFGKDGTPRTERRFVGFFTSLAYSKNPRDIPLLRLKIERVMRASRLDPKSHRGKALQHILDTFPRDDLFQITVADLTRISTEVHRLQGRRRVRLFCRRDVFGRFHACLVYLPRDQYSRRARERVEQLLMEAFKADAVDSHLTLSEAALARLEFTVHSTAAQLGTRRAAALEARIAAVLQTWVDRLRSALLERFDEAQALRLTDRFAEAFPAAYQEEIHPARAAEDVRRVVAVADGAGDMEMALHRPSAPGAPLRLSLCRAGEPIKLYRALPILEHLSLKVISAHVYRVSGQPRVVWIQDFEVEADAEGFADPDAVEARLLGCLRAVLAGDAESDGFNGFVLSAGLQWREALVLRACCKYLLQTSINYSQSYMQEVLAAHPRLARGLIDYFHALFEPGLAAAARKKLRSASRKSILQQLDGVVNLDQDRILRGFLSIIEATLRTNFFHNRPYVSFKLDPARIPELPEPRPMYELFVYSPRVEGVHLRCGRIARGGLRWSDRREDYRTETLGLMKAQMVKNTAIVPTGAKGGFVCKQLPPPGDREALRTEGVACYRTFVRGLLDLTDNIVGNRITGPDRLVRRDDDDPYLVVAADKGTATFSDIANEIAADYDFWLGDAFASGGSAGYDHKRMGITARGAWEGVKRHFRELDRDIQKAPFTVVGIGDMAGDVFGNAMLLSEHIKLIAAFNHAHIFIDPDPDPAASYRERRRLFGLPHSSWADYDASKLSEGGGVFSRQSKRIDLHPRARALLKLGKSTITPPELIRAILRARSDLLWNGGIGTYVKASTESHLDAGDPANDAVRIDAKALRCRVVGEGGNLGFTQRARIEFALGGGLINTDFIDNSGGVDSSDREVNIKILLGLAIERGELARSRRDALLAGMTDEVAGQVLENNYAQTQALSMMSARSYERLGESVRLIKALESRGVLDRALEHLPSEEDIEARRKAGRGLTRPELAIILSYSKMDLYTRLVDTDIPEDAYLARDLESYFPERLQRRFAAAIEDHRLRREIIARRIASSMVNRMGPAFAARTQEDTGSGIARVARAYAILREVFDVRALWKDIESLDNHVQAEVQYRLMFRISRMLRRTVYWFLRRHAGDVAVQPMVGRLRPGVREVLGRLAELESAHGTDRLAKDVQQLAALGVGDGLAGRIASMDYMMKALDIVEIAQAHRLGPDVVARLYFQIGEGVRFEWLRMHVEKLDVRGRWQAMARGMLRENVARQHRALLERVLDRRGNRSPEDALEKWLAEARSDIAGIHRTFQDMRSAGPMDFATVSVALKEIERHIR